eukprot:TRINITY_DN41418_c0_g1_i1.p1 TRINITY_DN41418_c0_g1~~TRINITY_DN41418_c0_g1_i1.p1  ORF type:complete len:676 (-),score=120.00 TRINITY_DN41418_c0_g1_i1:200-2227(-)
MFHAINEAHESPDSNAAMVDELVRMNSLRSKDCTDAFRAIERRHFWVSGQDNLIYADTPVRHGRLHLSAPQIYGEALESLSPWGQGLSFLNVGSGTGYFNSVVSELIGGLATNHGIEIWPEIIEHARTCCKSMGKDGIQFFHGNVYQLDIDRSMRYDRIYIGACANSRSKYLYRLLEVGGILVGPFQSGRIQQLRRVVRRTETEFAVDVLESVRFASLVEPMPQTAPHTPSPAIAVDASAATAARAAFQRGDSDSIGEQNVERADEVQQVGLPGVPFNFALLERPWTPERSELYPLSFRRAVAVSTASPCRPHSSLSNGQSQSGRVGGAGVLPREIWEQHIFPWCPRWWFESRRLSLLVRRDVMHGDAQEAVSCTDTAKEDTCAQAMSEDEDDGTSTRAPSVFGAGSSSGPGSAQSTPEVGPSPSPHAQLTDVGGIADDDGDGLVSMGALPPSYHPTGSTTSTSVGTTTAAEESPQEPSGLMFEVFGNGQRHAIGTEGDPDDVVVQFLRPVVQFWPFLGRRSAEDRRGGIGGGRGRRGGGGSNTGPQNATGEDAVMGEAEVTEDGTENADATMADAMEVDTEGTGLTNHVGEVADDAAVYAEIDGHRDEDGESSPPQRRRRRTQASGFQRSVRGEWNARPRRVWSLFRPPWRAVRVDGATTSGSAAAQDDAGELA